VRHLGNVPGSHSASSNVLVMIICVSDVAGHKLHEKLPTLLLGTRAPFEGDECVRVQDSALRLWDGRCN
jgi:hypothetical protein